jgi:uncharacterized membrane protein
MLKYIIIFLIYTFFGGVFEHFSYYIGNNFFNTNKKSLSNPIMIGFPLYGLIGLLIYYIYNKYLKEFNCILLFIIFGSIISIIEYIVGRFIVGAGIYGKNYDIVNSWDYKDDPFNFEGVISLRHFIMWGILGLIIIKVQPIIEKKLECIIHYRK